jgi:hypothetical protein
MSFIFELFEKFLSFKNNYYLFSSGIVNAILLSPDKFFFCSHCIQGKREIAFTVPGFLGLNSFPLAFQSLLSYPCLIFNVRFSFWSDYQQNSIFRILTNSFAF